LGVGYGILCDTGKINRSFWEAYCDYNDNDCLGFFNDGIFTIFPTLSSLQDYMQYMFYDPSGVLSDKMQIRKCKIEIQEY